MIRRPPMVLAAWLLLAAGAQASTPLDYTRTILDQARTIVASNQSQTGKLATLSVLFGKFLDSDEMGRQALGRHWSNFTPAQREEFRPLFRQLLQRTYVQTLLLFRNPNSSMRASSSRVRA